MKHHTKTLGDIGVLAAKLDLTKKGFIVCTPETEHAPFDIICYKNHMPYTVQVKARNLSSFGSIEVKFASSWADKNGTHTKKIDKRDIDIYCVYYPGTETCYYFDPKKFKEGITLRVVKPKNNQGKNINWHEDYLFFPENKAR